MDTKRTTEAVRIKAGSYAEWLTENCRKLWLLTLQKHYNYVVFCYQTDGPITWWGEEEEGKEEEPRRRELHQEDEEPKRKKEEMRRLEEKEKQHCEEVTSLCGVVPSLLSPLSSLLYERVRNFTISTSKICTGPQRERSGGPRDTRGFAISRFQRRKFARDHSDRDLPDRLDRPTT